MSEAIRRRREITRYRRESLEDAVLKQLVEAAYLAPSGNNLPSREFILVTNPEMLRELAGATPFMPWLAEAAAGVVVTGRPDVSKYWLQDASIACAFLWLEAVELGLGAAFGAVYHSEDAEESARRESFVRSRLGIPEDRRIVAVLGFGYPEQLPPPKEMYPKEGVMHYERFRARRTN